MSDSSSSEEDSSSSSEEDSSSSSSDASTPKKTVTIPVRHPKPSENVDADKDDVSSSSDESQDYSDEEHIDIPMPSSKPGHSELPLQRGSPSPQPNVDIPPFIPPDAPESEQALKDKFRKFWMASIAEGFKDDLEEIRKVCAP